MKSEDTVDISNMSNSNVNSMESNNESLINSDIELLNMSTESFIKKYDANSKRLYKRYGNEIGKRLHMKSFQIIKKYDKLKWYKYVQFVLCFLFLFPIRVIFSIFLLSTCFLVVIIATLFENLDKYHKKNPLSVHFNKPVHRIPKTRWRRLFISKLLKFCSGLIMRLCLGFYDIKVKDLRKRDSNGNIIKSPLIISNHNSLVDVLAIAACYDEVPSYLAMNWVRSVPIIGRVADGLQCIYVDPKNSKGLTDDIISRVKESKEYDLPPFVIFPEGTTTNGSHLIDFRYGAFYPLTAVQPITIKYNFKYFNPCWVVDTGIRYLIKAGSQFKNSIEVTLLPVIDLETEEEKTNVAVWKDKCFKVFLDALQVPSDLLASRPQKMAYEEYLRGRANFEETEAYVNQCIQKRKLEINKSK